MRNSLGKPTRNVILFTAPSSGGKSRYLSRTRDLLNGNMSVVEINDSGKISAAANHDHKTRGGRNHIHPTHVTGPDGDQIDINELYGVVAHRDGHKHERGAAVPEHHFPFIVVGPEIPRWQFSWFWRDIINATRDGVVLAELACGRNVNDRRRPEGKADYSYTTMAANFHKGTYPAQALDRILTVFHLITDLDVRLDRTHLRGGDRDDTVTRIFGDDDFYAGFAQLLEQQGARIVDIDNNQPKNEGDITTELREHLLDGSGIGERVFTKGERFF
ncbi:hypothetical protein HY357_00215 [Candidatus Roizmanbacteria bacterium]|nr:hypothetical protein [Candidatus Roizmanbacteria bacterium]